MKTISKKIIECFKRGGKLLICGNGGSASMSQHMAAELVCDFEKERKALPAIALTTDTSILTAFSNDHGFEHVFMRQVQALGKKGDILVIISTSINPKKWKWEDKPQKSENLLRAWSVAEDIGMDVVQFPIKGKTTAKIQEYQLKLMHDIVREVEKAFV